jgi:hypothetical protein
MSHTMQKPQTQQDRQFTYNVNIQARSWITVAVKKPYYRSVCVRARMRACVRARASM